MQKVDLNEGGAELPVWVFDFTASQPPVQPGFYFSFSEPREGSPIDALGPYPVRDDALQAAGRVAHEAVRAQATEELLSQNQGH